jgi:O-antigen/teichoic acid export membrane protein
VFNRLLPFLLLPVYTFYFVPAEYGVFSLVYSFWFLVIVFYLYGMETAFQKFFIEAKTFEERKSIFSTTITLLFITSVIFSLTVYALSTDISKLVTGSSINITLIRLLSIILLLDTVSRFPLILINSLQRSKLYTFVNSAAVVVNVVSNVVMIVWMKMGIEAIFYSYLISYSILFVISIGVTYEYFSFKIDFSKARSLFKFGQVFIYYSLFIMSMDLIDRFLLEYFKGKEIVGIYSASYRIGIVMNLLISGFRTAWMPFFLNLKEEADNKEIFSRVFTYFCYGGLVIFMAVSFLADDLVKVKIYDYSILNESYWSGLVILPFILLAYLFFGLYTNLNVASYFQNRTRYLLISSAIGFASNIIFNLILIPYYSFVGAAISTTLSYFLMFLVLYLFSQKIYRIDYEWGKIFYGVIITAAFYFLNFIISDLIKIGYLWVLLAEIFSVILLFIILFRKNLHNLNSMFKAKMTP